MQFNANHKVEHTSLTKEEAYVFVKFLIGETIRHDDAIRDAQREIEREQDKAMIAFLETAIRRHEKDISDTKELIKSVRHWHSLPKEGE